MIWYLKGSMWLISLNPSRGLSTKWSTQREPECPSSTMMPGTESPSEDRSSSAADTGNFRDTGRSSKSHSTFYILHSRRRYAECLWRPYQSAPLLFWQKSSDFVQKHAETQCFTVTQSARKASPGDIAQQKSHSSNKAWQRDSTIARSFGFKT